MCTAARLHVLTVVKCTGTPAAVLWETLVVCRNRLLDAATRACTMGLGLVSGSSCTGSHMYALSARALPRGTCRCWGSWSIAGYFAPAEACRPADLISCVQGAVACVLSAVQTSTASFESLLNS